MKRKVTARPGSKIAVPPAPPAPSASAAPGPVPEGAVLARLLALGPNGEPWIAGSAAVASGASGEANGAPRPARATVALTPDAVGREVLVCFTGPERVPVVVGVVVTPGDAAEASPAAPPLDLLIDRRRIVLTAQQEIVFRCGTASITLTPNGRVVVRGADVSSSATRTNRIRGGAVRIN